MQKSSVRAILFSYFYHKLLLSTLSTQQKTIILTSIHLQNAQVVVLDAERRIVYGTPLKKYELQKRKTIYKTTMQEKEKQQKVTVAIFLDEFDF